MQRHYLSNMNKLFIHKYIEIKSNSVKIDGLEDFNFESNSFLAFAKAVYKNYGIKYGKFYKMDALSKLGFLASELLLKDNNNEYLPEETALIFANASASLNTDIKYQKTIEEVPSPSVFVYTLANVVMGEICIRNTFRGETIFFVQDQYNTDFINKYVNNIFENTNTKQCITAWLEMSAEGNYNASMCLISDKKTNREFNNINIE